MWNDKTKADRRTVRMPNLRSKVLKDNPIVLRKSLFFSRNDLFVAKGGETVLRVYVDPYEPSGENEKRADNRTLLEGKAYTFTKAFG